MTEPNLSKRDMEEFFPDDDQIRADAYAGDPERKPEVGRLVEPDSEIEELDKIAEPVATDVGGDDEELSAEESAMHIDEG